MHDPREHALDHRLRFDECGADGLLRSGGYLRAMQDLAWRHSELLGMGRDWYRANGLAWLVRFGDLHITGEARSGDTLHLTTRVTGWRRVWARRESIASVGGTDVARATIDWVLIDARGRPARVPEDITRRFTDGIPTFEPARLRLADAPPGAATVRWSIGIRDLDPMGHVNNGTYLDMLDEALAAGTDALAGPRPPVRYQVEYLRPALPRASVSIVHWSEGGATAARYVDDHGGELARSRVTAG